MGRTKTHPVKLSAAGRNTLTSIVRTGSSPAQQVRRARILLELDENNPAHEGSSPTQQVVAERARVCLDAVVKVSKSYAEHGGDAISTVTRKKRLTPPVEAKITGEVEARLIALACTTPPEGHARWSLRLLEKQVLLTEGIPPLDHSSIGRLLRKRNFNLI